MPIAVGAIFPNWTVFFVYVYAEVLGARFAAMRVVPDAFRFLLHLVEGGIKPSAELLRFFVRLMRFYLVIICRLIDSLHN